MLKLNLKVNQVNLILTLLIGSMFSCGTRKIKYWVQKFDAGRMETRKVYNILGSDSAYLFGRVREFNIPAPLPSLVIINGIQVRTYNTGGAFFMKVPIGKSHVEARAIGYKKLIPDVVVAKGDELEINIYLKDSTDDPPLNCF